MARKYPLLLQTLKRISSPELRNQSTIAGDIMQEVWCQYLRGNYPCWRNGGYICYGAIGDNSYYHSVMGGRLCFAVYHGDAAIGLEALDAEGPLVACEVVLEKIPEPKARATRVKPPLDLSPFQPVVRDFAFVVDRTVKAGDIVRAAQNVDRKLIADVTVFDVYEGKGIEPGKKSIAIAVTIQPRDKTMTDAEIEALAAKIVAEVSKRTGGVLRA